MVSKNLKEVDFKTLQREKNTTHKPQDYFEHAKNSYDNLYHNAPVCYCTLDESSLISDVNLKTIQALGLEPEEIINKSLFNFIYKDDQNIYSISQKNASNSVRECQCEVRIVLKDGTLMWMLISITPFVEYTGMPSYRLFLSNISEQKRVQEELSEKEKMMIIQSRYAAMGEMTSMIVHQWRQPLNIIGLATTNMQTKKALHILDEASIDENTQIIAENIAFMSDTIDDFKNFFKPDAPQEIVSIEDIIQSTYKVIGATLRCNGIAFNVDNKSNTKLLMHKNSLVHVLINIIVNAKDAILSNAIESGAISVTVNETENTIALAVCDNAGGIPESFINKIAQNYYTTKKIKGTGLGLYIAQTIVEKHFFGTLTWHNELHGACFVITLNKVDKREREI